MKYVNRANTNSIKWGPLFQQMKFGKKDLLPVWVADMDFDVAPGIIEAIKDRLTHENFGYAYAGSDQYDSFIAWQEKHHGVSIAKEMISYVPSVLSGLSMMVEALSQPGDKVVIQPPVYGPFDDIPRMLGRQVVENQLQKTKEGYQVDLEDLAEKLEGARLMIIANPHNPVGKVFTKEELESIWRLCQEKDVILISDEVHGDFIWPGHTFTSMGHYLTEESQLLIFTSPGKTFNIANLNFAVAYTKNRSIKSKLDRRKLALHLMGASAFEKVAFQAAYETGESWLQEVKDQLVKNYKLVREGLAKVLPKAHLSPLEGTYLLWIDLSAYFDSHEALKKFFLEELEVAPNFGDMFGPGGEGHIRLNLATSEEILIEVIERMKKVEKRS